MNFLLGIFALFIWTIAFAILLAIFVPDTRDDK